MTGRILIIDTVATNRIVLRAKMLAAHFQVETCSSITEARALIEMNRPDVILINLSDPVERRHDFCKSLRSSSATAQIALIAMGVADTAAARFAALDAGADDVLPHPINGTLLLARIRSLMRMHGASAELMLRESTSRALGFEEKSIGFEVAGRVRLVTPDGVPAGRIHEILREGLRHSVDVVGQALALAESGKKPVPDLFVIEMDADPDRNTTLFGLVSDLRSRVETRRAAVMVILAGDQPEVAALFLDLGADDVINRDSDRREITLRAKALIKRKLHNDRLRATVQHGLEIAVTDPLTGLYNRRYAEPHLRQIAAQAQLNAEAFAVMMLDIDHFKRINDRYGHLVGDKVLRCVATCLRDNLRGVDLVARIGGEEFLIVMPRTSAAEARQAADRLRGLIAQEAVIPGPTGEAISVTVSVGVSVCGAELSKMIEPDALCDMADKALYRAKMAGRNRVAVGLSAA